ncbi:uncharacterized protein LOC143264507 [Megachile rotundata]|uniref:uncharacterized protein LOC143264507 n=1 Tax=Megachile rotundata TaxID=143995 RepID=UPI003FD3ED18
MTLFNLSYMGVDNYAKESSAEQKPIPPTASYDNLGRFGARPADEPPKPVEPHSTVVTSSLSPFSSDESTIASTSSAWDPHEPSSSVFGTTHLSSGP